jgi:type I restriction enzyme, S subunit
MKGYPEYKDSGIKWVDTIPSSWQIKRLKYLAENVVQKTSGSEFSLALENIQSWTGEYIESHERSELQGELVEFAENDVLFGKLRPYLAKVYLAKRGGACVGEFLVLKPKSVLLPRFLFYRLISRDFIEAVNSSTYGAKMPRANWQDFIGNISIPYPSQFSEQSTIAAFLDHKTRQIDELIAKKKRLIELLKEERTAVINRAVTKGIDPDAPMKDSGIEWLGEIPAHWAISKIKHLTKKIGSGVTPRGGSEVYLNEGIPFIRSQNIHNDRIDTSEMAYISTDIHEEMMASRVLPEDVLLNITGASIGRSFYYRGELGEANVNQHVCILRANEKLHFKYLHAFLISDYGQIQIDLGVTGSGREGLNFMNIGKFIVSLIPVEEQVKIVNGIDQAFEKINAIIHKTEKEIELLVEYKTSLINEAVTGKIDVRDYDFADA